MNKKKVNSTRAMIVFALLFIFIVILIIPEDFLREPTIVGEVLGVVRILGTNAPTFDHAIPNFTVNQTDPFFYDMNCSDVDPIDPTAYSVNLTLLNMTNETGIINRSEGFLQSEVENYSAVEFVCTDNYGFNVTETVYFFILDVNEPPELDPIGPQIATEGQAFVLDIDATDPENDNLTYNAVTSLFTLDPISGFINYTPTVAQIGNHTINFTVFDGQLYDHEVVLLTIVQGAFCGDNSCSSTESCDTCPEDCGVCPTLEGGGESGEGVTSDQPASEAGAQSTSTATAISSTQAESSAAPQFQCEEKWECSEWSVCSIDGLQTRSCVDVNRCNTERNKPALAQQCEYQPTCFDGIQNGGETGVDCGGNCEPCLIESCFDGIQNQGETGIDCGGPCKACQEEEFSKVPLLEIPGIIKIPRFFPWLLLLIISTVITALLSYDQWYIRHLHKKSFEDFREEIREYRPIRRKIYTFILNVSIVTLVAFFYIYIFSNSKELMIRFIFIPVILTLLTPALVAYIIRQYEYYEYMKIKKEMHMRKTHMRELLQLIKIENEVLYDLEIKLKTKIYLLASKHEFDEDPELYNKINEMYADITKLKNKRKERIELLRVSTTILDKIIAILESKNLEKGVKSYPEYKSIKLELQFIEDNKDLDTTNEEGDLIEDIQELSMPYMKTVITADKGLMILYNALVDLYAYYQNNHKMLRKKDVEIIGVERDFSDKIKALSKKSELMQKVQKKVTYSKLYNAMIDLFNHYMKKHQLSKAVEKS